MRTIQKKQTLQKTEIQIPSHFKSCAKLLGAVLLGTKPKEIKATGNILLKNQGATSCCFGGATYLVSAHSGETEILSVELDRGSGDYRFIADGYEIRLSVGIVCGVTADIMPEFPKIGKLFKHDNEVDILGSRVQLLNRSQSHGIVEAILKVGHETHSLKQFGESALIVESEGYVASAYIPARNSVFAKVERTS